MARRKKTKRTVEFGDFQTPIQLARDACRGLARCRIRPACIVEPTCGTGNFLLAALDQFPEARNAIGLDINTCYVNAATFALRGRQYAGKVRIICDSFFAMDWAELLRDLPEPLLVIGNPPWVTNADLGILGSSNLPYKSNFQRHSGLDAVTGKSNFDISEWMLIRILEWLDGRNATMAMLCKTAVARKVLMHAWKNEIHLEDAHIYVIDAAHHFRVFVDACFLVCRTSSSSQRNDCLVHCGLSATKAEHTFGYRDGRLVAEVALYERWRHLQGDKGYKWRSGVKHDCTKVMELYREGAHYRNGLQELVELEDDYLFPMLKSSDLVNDSSGRSARLMLVTQKTVGDDTRAIEHTAPQTWNYLIRHAELLDRRASSIYKNRPRFSVFGVGPYSFAPWKVAISGFYKRLSFKVVGSIDGRPVMLDDTSYFVPCCTKHEAEFVASLLNSTIAKGFFEAFVFWDAKRPITVDLLDGIDLLALARELGLESTMARYLAQQQSSYKKRTPGQVIQGGLFPI